MSNISLEEKLISAVKKVITDLYPDFSNFDSISLQQTRKDFSGDRTLVVFPFLKFSKKGPEDTAKEIGEKLINEVGEINDFNVIKGFLNLEVSDKTWLQELTLINNTKKLQPEVVRTVMVEYSSPNTNKPLHLGHIRNNLLGYSVSKIIEACGHRALKVQVINDRGIHICKSMLAWEKFGNGENPESSGKKGDHLVGDYYVKFDQEYKKEIAELIESGESKENAEKNAPILKEAQQMLVKWEEGDPHVVSLWKKMNQWVYDGFDVTYERMGVDFDKLYYESETYVLGKELVYQGLKDGFFYQNEDKSIWVDLTEYGLDQKLLMRSDGTSVYMTQDIGTAIKRFDDFKDLSELIYTVGNEQNYHFKVLFLILKKLGYKWADECKHLSYGMVELPSGKMKSREGTVVDADDLMDEMVETARQKSEELGKLNEIPKEERGKLFNTIGMGALKYFILKVDPKKQIVFNPEESIEFVGNTGPFIQYTYARIKTLLNKSNQNDLNFDMSVEMKDVEKEIIKLLYLYPSTLKQAMDDLSPSLIGNYIYDLVKNYNHFYQSIPILKEDNLNVLKFRLNLSEKVALTIKSGMNLMGIEVPERM